MISNMNVALNKFSVKSLYMSICQNLYNMSVKRCVFYLYYIFYARRFNQVQTPWFVNYMTRDIAKIV